MITRDWNRKVFEYSKHFKLGEFLCKCGKCQSDAYINPKLITYLDELRKYFNRPVYITSGIRCKSYNDKLIGSSPDSAHLYGNAADIFIKGVNPKRIHSWWRKNVPSGYSYYGTKNMGNCCHVEIK